MHDSRRLTPVVAITAAICGLIGLYNLIGGAWLLAIGGSAYYLSIGIAFFITAWLIARRHQAALWVYSFILAGSMIWAIAEVGFDFWALAPRGDILLPLGIWILSPFISRQVGATNASRLPLAASIGLGVLVVGYALIQDPQDISGNLPQASGAAQIQSAANAAVASAADVMPDEDWRAYGRTQAGTRFSPLKQITPDNVAKLKVAWIFRTGDLRGPNDTSETTYEVTPLKVGKTVYLCSPHEFVFALDAATGKLKWKFDPRLVSNPTFQHLTCRGVSYHETAADAVDINHNPAPAECAHRLFLPTNDGRLIAINADDGTRCTGFGNNGEIDLKEGSEVQTAGFYEGTSPPVVTDKIVIMSGSIIDNYSTHEPSGVTRGYDVYTGKLVWAFDTGNPDPNEMPLATHHFTANSPNSWIVSSYDPKLNMVYIPYGTGTPDIWGGNRTPDMERYDSALVALDADTGKLVWSYQNVHHDLWDMDMPSQPSLADVTQSDGSVIPTIYAPAKTGNIFVLDRRNGKLVVPAPETPVPGGAAPGDHVSPTQPYSELSYRPRDKLTGADMWGATMFDQLACRILFHRLRYDGPFTPPSTQGTLVFPGDFGMFEWGGISIDTNRQIAIANPMGMAFVSQLIPRGPNNPAVPDKNLPAGSETGVQPQFGVPFGVKLGAFLSPLGLPCMKPSWGFMSGIDLRTNKIIWKHRVGTIHDSSPVPLDFKLGVPMLGGPMTTAGGVTFMTGTLDNYIRAFDVTTGAMLWQDRLPAGGQSTPMSYGVDGKQFVLTVDGGHGSFGTKLGDYVIAYALPDGD